LRLPSLSRHAQNIFQTDLGDISDNKLKVIRVSMDKLKPLNVEEVKRRFMMKYQREEQEY